MSRRASTDYSVETQCDLRSKPSSRTALTGEQPDPWNLLQLQDATGRHRTCLHRFRWRRLYLHPAKPMARGRRLVALINLPDVAGRETPPRSEDLSRYGVMRMLFALLVSHSADFPRYCRLTSPVSYGFTVISRCSGRHFCRHTPMLRCQTAPSMWTLGRDQPVIPRVPFSR